jgi:hypothetical protein
LSKNRSIGEEASFKDPGGFMAITFQKRQKEMKRLEKQRMKEERRAQKKLEKRAKEEAGKTESVVSPETPPEN